MGVIQHLPFIRHLAPGKSEQPRRIADDESGALPVFEAIIAGMMILTAILFLTAIGRPAPATGQGGIDLGQNAADTLSILRDRDADAPLTYPDRLTEVVELAMTGDTADAKEFLDEIVPIGTRYLLRLDNGVEPLILLPHGSGPELNPRAAQAASVLVIPDWVDNGLPSTVLPTSALSPADVIPNGHAADSVNAGGTAHLFAPNGAEVMPDGTPWLTYWLSAEYVGTVPPNVPYGVWKACPEPCLAGSETLFKIYTTDRTEAAYPMYGVQLVVWLAA